MQPYLSVVAASRNDDHGGDPLHRTQIFINCFAQQCDRYKLPAELILVDWNPVANRPGLASVLQLPAGNEYCSARVITVPAALHNSIKYGDRLAFFQMIAKNVAIRRAKGEFVLATNIDIIFSNELVAFLAGQKLDPQRMYRVDRYDIKTELTIGAGVDIVLDKAWGNIIRTNRRANLQEVLDPIYGHDAACRDCRPHIQPQRQSEKIALVQADGQWQLRPHPGSPIEHLNTNACGDFTLLSKAGWAAIRGYPDFEAFSFNIDSMGLVMAHYEGFHETSLLPPCVCFHIEHGLGSGYTPEGEQTLFDRIRIKRILSPDWPVLTPWVEQMRARQRSLPFNRDDWGLADYDLPEQPLGSVPTAEWQHHAAGFNPIAGSVGSLRPEYDLDSVTLFHEREARLAAPNQGASAPVPAPVVTVIPVVPSHAVELPRSPAVALFCSESNDGLFDHPHDSRSLRQHFEIRLSEHDRPLVVWGSSGQVEHVLSLLAPNGNGPLMTGRLADDAPGGAAGDIRRDTLLLATDPKQMILDLHRYGMLLPRDQAADLMIWVRDGSPVANHQQRWRASVKLARRLLAAVSWRVQVASQSELR